jgi:hypothetical protein
VENDDDDGDDDAVNDHESKNMIGGRATINTTMTSQQQRIILLAGPHKTGSTSTQIIALNFAKVLNNSWNWIFPPEVKRRARGRIKSEKNMAALIFAMTNRANKSRRSRSTNSNSEMLTLYRTEIRQQLELGLNILLGSEEIDSVASSPGDALDVLLTIFPAEAIKNISVVIAYRAPRIQHLMSLWKQLLGENKGENTFYDFLHTPIPFHAIDSLSMADSFLQRGFQVYMLDLAGMSSHGYEMHSVLGCDLMQLPCDDTKMPLSLKSRPEILSLMRKKQNVRRTRVELNVTESQLEQMDDLLKNYDCAFQGLIQHDDLTVLYNDQFGRNMRNCGVTSSTGMSKIELLASLKAIVHA